MGTLVVEGLGVGQLPVVCLSDQGQTKALRGKEDGAHSERWLDLFNLLLQTLWNYTKFIYISVEM